MCIAVPNVGVAGFINGKLFCFINLFYNLPIFWNYVGIQIRTSTILSDVINSIDDNRKQWLLKDAVDSYQGRASETYSCAADKKSMNLINSFYFLCKKLWVFSRIFLKGLYLMQQEVSRQEQGSSKVLKVGLPEQHHAPETVPCLTEQPTSSPVVSSGIEDPPTGWFWAQCDSTTHPASSLRGHHACTTSWFQGHPPWSTFWI